MPVRDADPSDVPRILAILNRAIVETTAIWDEAAVTAVELEARLAARRAAGFPTLVVEDAAGVAGFASLGPFRPFAGYRMTLEHSLYVDPEAQRRGHGKALLHTLEERAGRLGCHALVGGIAAENAASLALHRSAGFVETGRMPEVGYKFGRFLDLVFVQKRLGATLAPGGPSR